MALDFFNIPYMNLRRKCCQPSKSKGSEERSWWLTWSVGGNAKGVKIVSFFMNENYFCRHEKLKTWSTISMILFMRTFLVSFDVQITNDWFRWHCLITLQSTGRSSFQDTLLKYLSTAIWYSEPNPNDPFFRKIERFS